MVVPIKVIASARPTPQLLAHVGSDAVLIADQATVIELGALPLAARGQVVISEPDVYYRSPACDCCTVREDLVSAVIRATRRSAPVSQLAVFVDPVSDDLLTLISTILSSVEISRRCELDAVLVELSAVDLATRLNTVGDLHPPSTGVEDAFDGMTAAVALADRIVLRGAEQVTPHVVEEIRNAVSAGAGFARTITPDSIATSPGQRIDGWHGAPAAVMTDSGRSGRPATIVLRVDQPLDPEAIDEWLDMLVARHASRLLRVQGALSVAGHDERTCCYGVRSFATSHSERQHATKRSAESVLAICGIGLDADELAASFQATVAS